MLDVQNLEKVDGFRHKVGVEFVQTIVEKSCEVLWQVVGLLKARAETVSKCSDIRNVLVLANLGFVLNVILEFSISFRIQEPLENSFLNLLVILIFKEIVFEKLHRAHHVELSLFSACVNCCNWSIWRERNRST